MVSDTEMKKNMNIKNYTSTVPANRSVEKIERTLVDLGATNIVKSYNDKKILDSILFVVVVEGNSIPFKLPAKTDLIFNAFWREVQRPHDGTRQKIAEQAERTAWKLLLDWVLVQATMIKLQQAEITEVFLPYVLDMKTNQTFFEKIKGGGFKLLTSGN